MSDQYIHSWIKTDSIENYSPITQVYGICFNDEGQILIARSSATASWQIPGGHPENNEKINQTLQRELIEEVDIEVEKIKLLGVQKVEVVDYPDKTHYQVRCICKIKKLNPQTIDPANGSIWERKFVDQNEINEYVKWGSEAEKMFEDAINLNKKLAKHN